MPANQDFRDLFKILNEEQVEYLVAGAHAVIFYTEPRYTKDIDIWVNPMLSNANRVFHALKKFGAPLRDIRVKDFDGVPISIVSKDQPLIFPILDCKRSFKILENTKKQESEILRNQ